MQTCFLGIDEAGYGPILGPLAVTSSLVAAESLEQIGQALKRAEAAVSDSKLEFAIVLFAGMIVFGIFAECVQRAPGLIVSQPNFVKKVVFPLELMAWTSMGAART